MKIRVQLCWKGSDRYVYRALICGGLLVPSPDGKWSRKVASKMLDLLEVELSIDRCTIRFVHI